MLGARDSGPVCMRVLSVVAFIFLSLTTTFSVVAEASISRVFVFFLKNGTRSAIEGAEVYCQPSDKSETPKSLGSTDETGRLILNRSCVCGSFLYAHRRPYPKSKDIELTCMQWEIPIQIGENVVFSSLLKNWRRAILSNEPAVAALCAAEFASRVSPQLRGRESSDDLSQALEAGLFDEAIAITARLLEVHSEGTRGYEKKSRLSPKLMISRNNSQSLAVIFAKRALDANDVGITFDRTQSKVVMKEEMKSRVLRYQALQGLKKTGSLDYPTLSRLAETTSSTLIYSDWHPSDRHKVVFQLLDNLKIAVEKKLYGVISLVAAELAYRVYGLGKRYSQDRFLDAIENKNFDQALMVTADYVKDYKSQYQYMYESPIQSESLDTIFPTGVISRKTAESLVVISAKQALGVEDDAVIFDSLQGAAVMTESMEEEVRKYQRSQGLPSTGHLDYSTLSRLAGIPSSQVMYSGWPTE